MTQLIYGVDMGTSNIKLYNIGTEEIINEKNIIAVKDKKQVFDFGDRAFEMYEKAPDNIVVTFPIKNGVIADLVNMETLFTCFFKRINDGRVVTGADFCISVPTDITEVEKRAFFDVIMDAKIKAKRINVVEKPIADAVGVGIDIESPKGNMIVNVGSDTTEISIISMGGIVLSKLIKTGGNKLDDAICNCVRKKHNLIIGMRTAEKAKMALADATFDEDDGKVFTVYGRNIVSGLPTSRQIGRELIYEAISEHMKTIVDNIKVILERTPPELAADIIDTGVYLTGGSASIKNFDKLLNDETGLKINVVDKPSESVIKGLKKIVSTPEYSGLMYVPREKQYK